MVENQPCPVCGNSGHNPWGGGYDLLVPGSKRFNLVSCQGCGLVYIPGKDGVPDNDEIYRGSYYRNLSGLAAFVERWFLRRRRREGVGKRPAGRLLDLGCGTGAFLRTMAEAGWECWGVEPSSSAAASFAGCRVFSGELKNAGFEDNFFDAVTLWQVLEHLPDPRACLLDIRRILKDDGVIVISVPNIESFQAFLGGESWFALELPRHRWQFSARTLTGLLEKNGFEVKKIRHFSLEYAPFSWWQTFFNKLGCEPNFAFKLLKRGELERNYSVIRRIYSAVILGLLGAPLLLIALSLSVFESLARRGGIITAIAVKKSGKPFPGASDRMN